MAKKDALLAAEEEIVTVMASFAGSLAKLDKATADLGVVAEQAHAAEAAAAQRAARAEADIDRTSNFRKNLDKLVNGEL